MCADTEVPPWLVDLFGDVAKQMRLLHHVSLRVGESVSGPMVYGVLWPVILLPAGFLSSMPHESLRVILVHELAHVRRRDLLFAWVQRLVESAFFYHPAIWWLSRLVDRERETACDAAAVRLVGRRLAVATALVDSADAITAPAPAVAFAANGGSLHDRVVRLVDPSCRPRFQVPWTSFAALMLIGLAGFTSLILGTRVVAMQVAEALTPSERVQAVEKAIEQSETSERKSTVAEAVYTVSGRFVAPQGSEFNAGHGGIVSQSKNFGTSASIRINEDGSFQKAVRGPATMIIYPQLEGFAERSYGPFELIEGPLDLGEIQLETGFNARMLVQNDHGEPLQNVMIESATNWRSANGHRMGYGGPRLRGRMSDAQGLIELDHMTDQPVTISLVKPGYEYSRREITFTEDATIDWKLAPSDPLTGRFVDAEGEPVAAVELYLVHRDGDISQTDDPRPDFLNQLAGKHSDKTPLAVSDTEGRFRVESLRSDTNYWLMALHREYRPRFIKRVTAGQMLEPITLDEPLVIKGTINGDLSKLSVRSQQRYVRYRNLMSVDDTNFDAIFDCGVDDQGRFEITQLLSGEVKIFAADQTLKLQVGESMDNVVFDLQNPQRPVNQNHRRLRVVLNSTAGQPLRGEVQLTWQLPEPPDRGPQSDYKAFPVGDGVIEWESPPGATIFFHGQRLVGSYAENGSLGVVPQGQDVLELSVDLAPAGLASGQVVDHDGNPVSNYRIDIDRTEGRVHTFQVLGVRIDQPSGRFALGPLPLGVQHQYQPYVQVADSWRLAVGDPFTVTGDNPVHTQTIEVPPIIHLSGRVLNPYGEPVAGTALSMTWNYESTSRAPERVNRPTARADSGWRFRPEQLTESTIFRSTLIRDRPAARSFFPRTSFRRIMTLATFDCNRVRPFAVSSSMPKVSHRAT